ETRRETEDLSEASERTRVGSQPKFSERIRPPPFKEHDVSEIPRPASSLKPSDHSGTIRMDGGGFRGNGHLFQVGCPGRLLHPGIPPASNVDLTTAPFRVSPDSTVRR